MKLIVMHPDCRKQKGDDRITSRKQRMVRR